MNTAKKRILSLTLTICLALSMMLTPVSYTHLTLPTNREV